MVTIQQPEGQRWLKLLVYGSSGAGKTVFAATAQDDPRTAPTLVADMEGGTDSLVGKQVDVARVRTWEDFGEVYRLAQDRKYRCVVVDSLSEVQIFAFETILKKDSNKRHDKDLMTQQDFGVALTQMRRFLRAWLDLPAHVIFTALSKDVLDPREGQVIVPKFAGQFPEDVSGLMSAVAYLALTTDEQTRETRRVLLLKNQSKFRVKIRTPIGADVPDTIIEPTVGKLLDVLRFPAPAGTHT